MSFSTVVRTFSFTNVLCPGIAQQNEETDKSSPASWKMRNNTSVCIYFEILMGRSTSLTWVSRHHSAGESSLCSATVLWIAYEIIIFPIFHFRHFSSPLCSTNQRRKTKVIKEDKTLTAFVL